MLRLILSLLKMIFGVAKPKKANRSVHVFTPQEVTEAVAPKGFVRFAKERIVYAMIDDEPTFPCYREIVRQEEESEEVLSHNTVVVPVQEEAIVFPVDLSLGFGDDVPAVFGEVHEDLVDVPQLSMDELYKLYLNKVEPDALRKKEVDEWREMQNNYDAIRKRLKYDSAYG